MSICIVRRGQSAACEAWRSQMSALLNETTKAHSTSQVSRAQVSGQYKLVASLQLQSALHHSWPSSRRCNVPTAYSTGYMNAAGGNLCKLIKKMWYRSRFSTMIMMYPSHRLGLSPSVRKSRAVATKKKLVRPKYEECEKKNDGKSCEARQAVRSTALLQLGVWGAL